MAHDASFNSALVPGSHWLHVDGGLYRFLNVGKDAASALDVVIYEHLHPFERGIWTRPVDEFNLRFSPISDVRAQQILDLLAEPLRQAIAGHKARRRAQEAAIASLARPASPKLYCLGFMFSPDRSRVALIRKLTPSWQAGLLNGIGGKSEPGESLAGAMAREFLEEAGVSTQASDWDLFARLGSPDFQVHVFRCFSDQIDSCRTLTAEAIEVFPIDLRMMVSEGISGLASLVCCALDADELFVRFDYRQWAEAAREEAAAIST